MYVVAKPATFAQVVGVVVHEVTQPSLPPAPDAPEQVWPEQPLHVAHTPLPHSLSSLQMQVGDPEEVLQPP